MLGGSYVELLIFAMTLTAATVTTFGMPAKRSGGPNFWPWAGADGVGQEALEHGPPLELRSGTIA